MIPSGPGSSGLDDGDWLYCVSLVFHKNAKSFTEKATIPLTLPQCRKFLSEREINNECVRELRLSNYEAERETVATKSNEQYHQFISPLLTTASENGEGRKMKVSGELKEFNRKL